MEVDFKKYSDGLVPAIVQDQNTSKVLMLGFMNDEALQKTISEKKVTFYSRSRKRLWTKGEESGHFLHLKNWAVDCDGDTILIKAIPTGPVCHTGADTCWNEKNSGNFLDELERIISSRFTPGEEKSYVRQLYYSGINKIAQKVGEEAVELVIESKDNNEDLFINEAADLLFHFLILLKAKGHNLHDVVDVLEKRHSK